MADARIPSASRGGGFTLLEIAVALTLLTFLFLGIWQAMSLCAGALHSQQVAAELDTAAQKIYVRVADELRESGTGDDGEERVASHPLVATTVSSTLTFQMRRDFTGDPSIDWTTPITYALAAKPGEVPGNAVDDDGDGLVDEQRLTRTQDGVSTVLADHVTQLLFSRRAGEFRVDFQATIARAFGPDPTLVTRVVTATVALENKGKR